MVFDELSIAMMKCKEENCEVGMLPECGTLIVLSEDKLILCTCGRRNRPVFDRE